ILSIVIGALIVWTAWDVVRESLNILLEGMPRGMLLGEVVRSIHNVPGVLEVHDLHVWSLGSGTHALSCHAVINDMPPSESECILQGINTVLARELQIHHTTIQFEHNRCAVGESGCCMDERPYERCA
ncbi:MAG: cation transporter, partial [Bryobacteraceae bacterium]|nr:cation transporter [Bryobacteraceae bacterium]